jgi:16S rRNA (uracil1498-N3)-methyltransferase
VRRLAAGRPSDVLSRPMHHFYLSPDQCVGTSLVLAGSEAHHARDVARIRRGERVTVVDGAGQALLCELIDYAGDEVRLSVLERNRQTEPPARITLLQAVPKGKLMEVIIQKATELGVHRIVPLLSQRVVADLDEAAAARKAQKWKLVALEAIKQCGSAWLPVVEMPLTPDQFLGRQESFELPLIASLEKGSRPARDCFSAFRSVHGRNPGSACIWVGPEGDFTPAETEAIRSHGALPISLGQLVLRTETAAIYCLSVLHYELQPPGCGDGRPALP